MNPLVNQLKDFVHYEISLAFDDVRNVFVVDAFMNFTLHHGRTTIVFNVTFPLCFWHLQMFSETLLSEIFNSIIICVCHKILNSQSLSMCFESVHQTCSIPFHLMLCWNCKEHYLNESLSDKWAENAATNNWPSLRHRSVFAWILFTTNYHGLVLPVHDQSYNVIPRHSWKLFGDDVLYFN